MKISKILKDLRINHFSKGISAWSKSEDCLYDTMTGNIFFSLNTNNKPLVLEELVGYEWEILEIFNNSRESSYPVEEIDLYFIRKSRNEKLNSLIE